MAVGNNTQVSLHGSLYDLCFCCTILPWVPCGSFFFPFRTKASEFFAYVLAWQESSQKEKSKVGGEERKLVLNKTGKFKTVNENVLNAVELHT